MHKNRNKVPSFHVCISRKVVHPGSSDHRRLNKQEAFNGADCSGTRLMMSWLPMPCGFSCLQTQCSGKWAATHETGSWVRQMWCLWGCGRLKFLAKRAFDWQKIGRVTAERPSPTTNREATRYSTKANASERSTAPLLV